MELRQLEYFLMVSKVGSFTRAAERLYVSQPAVTNAIRNLEAELGVLLFDRGQKQALLTAEGQVFFKHVEHVMHGVSQTISEINQMKNLASGTLTLGVTPVAGISAFVDFLERFQAACPQIRLKVMEGNVSQVQQALIADRIELGLVLGGEANHLITFLPLAQEEIVLCCSRRHAFASLAVASLPELVETPLLLFPPECLLRKKLLAAFEETNTLPRIKLELQHVQTIKSFIAQDAGISLLPRSLAEDERLAAVPLSPPLWITAMVACKKNKSFSHAAQAFWKMAEQICLADGGEAQHV